MLVNKKKQTAILNNKKNSSRCMHIIVNGKT